MVIPPKDPNPKPSKGGDPITGTDYNDLIDLVAPGGTYATGDLLYASSASALARRALGSSGRALIVSAGLPNYALHSRLAHSLGYFTNFDLTLSPTFTPLGDLTLTTTATPVITSPGIAMSSGRTMYLLPVCYFNLRTNDASDRTVDFWWEVDQDDGNGFVQRTGKFRAYVGSQGHLRVLSLDETQNSGTVPNTDTNTKTYSLAANSYTKVIAEAEGFIETGTLSADQDIDLKVKYGATQVGQTMKFNPVAIASGKIPFNIKASAAQTGAATIAVTKGAAAADANTIVNVNSLRVYAEIPLTRKSVAVGVSFRDINDIIWWNGGIIGPTPGLGDGNVYINCVAQVIESGGQVITSDRYASLARVLRD